MKYKNYKIGLLLISCFLIVFGSCEKPKDPMAPGIVDVNSYITSIDKTVTEPGDVVTFTGTNLDKVYKIMLNEETTPVEFEATSTQLQMMVPALTPLGDAVTVSLFFSGKGLAQRALKIISPPVIMAMSPVAGHSGDEIQLMGRELYLAESITVGGVDVTSSFNLIDDKNCTIVLPDGFAGGDVVITTETGGESTSPHSIILGIELLVTNVDNDGEVLASYGPYSNASGEVADDDFPRSSVYTITIEDNGSSWGANCDFNFSSLPADIEGTPIDITKVEMWQDVKASKELNINFMIGKAHNPPGLWGRSKTVTTDWQTIVVPFTDLGQGYGNDPITDDPLIPFEEYTLIKWSLPAQSSASNFGETITFDNVKFIIRD